jgi:hemerythrin
MQTSAATESPSAPTPTSESWPVLRWQADLALDHPVIDATHQEFVDLLAAVLDHKDQGQAAQMPHFKALIEHSIVHFGQEDRWMQDTGFAPENCHSRQHQQVLALMSHIEERAHKGEDGVITLLCQELGSWFVQHVDTVDAALAYHLQQVGYDTATGEIAHPEKVFPSEKAPS